MLQKGVGGEHRVVGLDDGGGHLGGGGHREGELGLATVVHREALEEEGSETGPGSTTSGVEDEEALEAGTVVGKLADPIEDEVDDFLPRKNEFNVR